MKKVKALAFVIALTALVAQGQEPITQTGKDRTAEQDVRRLNTEESAAFLHKEPKALARLWSDDFVVTNPPE